VTKYEDGSGASFSLSRGVWTRSTPIRHESHSIRRFAAASIAGQTRIELAFHSYSSLQSEVFTSFNVLCVMLPAMALSSQFSVSVSKLRFVHTQDSSLLEDICSHRIYVNPSLGNWPPSSPWHRSKSQHRRGPKSGSSPGSVCSAPRLLPRGINTDLDVVLCLHFTSYNSTSRGSVIGIPFWNAGMLLFAYGDVALVHDLLPEASVTNYVSAGWLSVRTLCSTLMRERCLQRYLEIIFVVFKIVSHFGQTANLFLAIILVYLGYGIIKFAQSLIAMGAA
jgi:hypothetical protein